jgi:hypothetical protein
VLPTATDWLDWPQLTRDRVRLQKQLEGFLEESRIKLSSHVSDLLGLSGKRMLQAWRMGTDPARIASLGSPRLQAKPGALADALSGVANMSSLRRQILKLFLKRLELLETQIDQMDQSMAETLQKHQDGVHRLAKPIIHVSAQYSRVKVDTAPSEEACSRDVPRSNIAQHRLFAGLKITRSSLWSSS